MRTINDIIIHCSATPEGKNFTTQDIRQWHLAQGWTDIGYHYIIHLDGTIHTGRPITQPGAHCRGHNAHSIGICYIGGLATDNRTPKDTRTPAQRKSLLTLLRNLRTKYPSVPIHGHRDYAPKACPSFDAAAEYAHL